MVESDQPINVSATAQTSPPGPLRALVVLGSSSIVTVVAGLASSKVAATMIGAEGVGLMALVLTIVSVTNVTITAGVGQSLVRVVGRGEPVNGGTTSAGAWVRSARRIVGINSLVLLVVAGVAGPFLAEPVLGDGAATWWPVAIAATTALYTWGQLQISVLVAHHRVNLTARAAVSTAFVSPAVNAVCFALLGVRGVVPGALISSALVTVVLHELVRRTVGREMRDARSIPGAARRLLTDGLPLVPVSLMGGVAILVVLLVVDRTLSRDEVGYFRAGTTISLAYMVLISASIVQDFFPRLSRLSTDRQAFGAACDEQIRLILLLAGPLVAGLTIVLPLVVRAVFSAEFSDTTLLMEWQVIGDVLKLISVTLATAVLVRFGAGLRLLPEAVGAVAIVACSLAGLSLFGLRGLGVGYLGAYMAYFAALITVLHRWYRPSPDVLMLLATTVAALLVVPVVHLWVEHPAGRASGLVPFVLLAARSIRELGAVAIVRRLMNRSRTDSGVAGRLD